MSVTAEQQDGFAARDAIDAAFAHFRRFYDERVVSTGLLEGVRYDEDADAWLIAIGFDTDKEEVVRDRPLLDLPEREVRRAAREAREFVFDGATGAFKEMRRLPE